MAKKSLTHLDSSGKAKMVDVSAKGITARVAVAEGFVGLQRSTVSAIKKKTVAKGEVLAVARVAGILAAKRTAELIPLCHPLALDNVEVDFDLPDIRNSDIKVVRIRIKATARMSAKTGVEMEALTAVAVAALTIYDMCKGIDKSMEIGCIHLLAKTGGSSGDIGQPEKLLS